MREAVGHTARTPNGGRRGGDQRHHDPPPECGHLAETLAAGFDAFKVIRHHARDCEDKTRRWSARS
jgi:hypothetical protein